MRFNHTESVVLWCRHTLYSTILALSLPLGIAYAKRSEACVVGAKTEKGFIRAVKATEVNT